VIRAATIAALAVLLNGCGDFGQPFGGPESRGWQFRNSLRPKELKAPRPATPHGGAANAGAGGKVWDAPCDPDIMPRPRECE
jgi:hypothetical protein